MNFYSNFFVDNLKKTCIAYQNDSFSSFINITSMSKNTCIFRSHEHFITWYAFDVLPWNKSANEFFIFSPLTIVCITL